MRRSIRRQFEDLRQPLIVVTVSCVILYALLLYSKSEMVFIFDPWIDTNMSPGFSEKAFQKVKVEMSEQEVVRFLGQPLNKVQKESGDVEWWFTRDGKCSWGDFAWMARVLVLSNHVVVEVHSMTHYD
jgi:hypothetical protein